jgi:flavin-dependent dehydrogenase
LKTLVKLGLLNEEELNSIIGIEFNPVRVGFNTDISSNSKESGFNIYVNDILNLGIRPDKLISLIKQKYIIMGGNVFEDIGLSKLDLYKNTAVMTLTSNPQDKTPKIISTKLVIDAMGNASPISKQIRGPIEPDGICIVVGGCARGYLAENNTYSDLIFTDTPITQKSDSQLQYYWEAFPSGSGQTDRTTYLFTYMDAKKERPSISEIMEDYFELLPRYQGINIDDLDFLRVLYGCFPTYRNSPLQTIFPRVLQVGDASGIQSPLSFGGFGSLTRHLGRIKNGVKEAIDNDLLNAEDLACNYNHFIFNIII